MYAPDVLLTIAEYTERDYDSDTQQDLLRTVVCVGVAPTVGSVSVYSVYSGWTGSMLFEVTGVEPDDLFGFSTAGVDDITGDGKPDLIVHAGAHDAMGDIVDTRAYVFSGAPNANASLLYTFTASDPIIPPPPTGDDGTLDQLRLVIGNFGQENATLADGDLNGDGVVDSLDLAWLVHLVLK